MGTKRIIICCDGTWNNPEQKEVTNVVKAERAGLVFDRDYLGKIIRPDFRGKLHRSYRGIYWTKKRYLRPIGKLGEDLEKIHPSVRQRMAAVENYRPKNVIKERYTV